ncbi:MAG TPA: hypothetical protein VJS43_06570 [Candidatus Acidoferrales bacterium]|nr:hypothetical protein [Candidatus Acidoferrales bacterium]
MRKIAIVFFVASSLMAQTRTAHRAQASRVNADQLGFTCVQILDMTSAEWVTKFTAAKGSDPVDTIGAIGVYGKCYDARTDRLAARLRKTGKGPLTSARTNFQSVEQALKAFAAKALAESDPPGDAVKSAYAALYEKQFRYEFYESYEPKPPASATQTSAPPAKEPAPPSGSPAGSAPTSGDKASSRRAMDSPSQTDGNIQSKDREKEVDPLTAAKNHFGGLLGDLSDERMHDLHRAFGEILGPNSATPQMQLLIYRYAIFLMEPPGGTPFSPAPF